MIIMYAGTYAESMAYTASGYIALAKSLFGVAEGGSGAEKGTGTETGTVAIISTAGDVLFFSLAPFCAGFLIIGLAIIATKTMARWINTHDCEAHFAIQAINTIRCAVMLTLTLSLIIAGMTISWISFARAF